jgi:hypothetical protein
VCKTPVYFLSKRVRRYVCCFVDHTVWFVLQIVPGARYRSFSISQLLTTLSKITSLGVHVGKGTVLYFFENSEIRTAVWDEFFAFWKLTCLIEDATNTHAWWLEDRSVFIFYKSWRRRIDSFSTSQPVFVITKNKIPRSYAVEQTVLYLSENLKMEALVCMIAGLC